MKKIISWKEAAEQEQLAFARIQKEINTSLAPAFSMPEYSCPCLDKILVIVARHDLGEDEKTVRELVEKVRAINKELRERWLDTL